MIEVLSMVAAMALQAEAPKGPEGKGKEGLPLEPTRRIEFETDEATWLSLDVSPDGQSLLLEIAGDLYTLDRIWPSEKKLRTLWWWTSSPNSLWGARN